MLSSNKCSANSKQPKQTNLTFLQGTDKVQFCFDMLSSNKCSANSKQPKPGLSLIHI